MGRCISNHMINFWEIGFWKTNLYCFKDSKNYKSITAKVYSTQIVSDVSNIPSIFYSNKNRDTRIKGHPQKNHLSRST